MKTMRVTISRDGVEAVCTMKYRLTDSPDEAVWTGDRRAFSYKGMMIDFAFPLSSLESAVSHQAALCGATYKIEDLGGEAERWLDYVHEPIWNKNKSSPPPSPPSGRESSSQP